jgi:hypothetical protein
MQVLTLFANSNAFEKALYIAFGLVMISIFISPPLFPLSSVLALVETSGYFFSTTQIAVICGLYSIGLIVGIAYLIEPMMNDF